MIPRTSIAIRLLLPLLCSLLAMSQQAVANPTEPRTDVPPRVLRPAEAVANTVPLRPFRAQYRGKAGDERVIRLSAGRWQGEDSWLYEVALGGLSLVRDEHEVLAATLSPRLRRVSAPGLSHTLELWQGWEEGRGWKVAPGGSSMEPVALTIQGERFPGGLIHLLAGPLGLHPGEGWLLPVFSSDFGPSANLWMELEALGTKDLDLAGRRWAAVHLRIRHLNEEQQPLLGPGGAPFPAAELWVVEEPPYLLRLRFGPQDQQLLSFSTSTP